MDEKKDDLKKVTGMRKCASEQKVEGTAYDTNSQNPSAMERSVASDNELRDESKHSSQRQQLTLVNLSVSRSHQARNRIQGVI